MAKTNLFAVQVFFIVFRECLEAVVVVSVLLAFLKQSLGQPDQDRSVYVRRERRRTLGEASTGERLTISSRNDS
jgi:high-affinity iron transporter